MVEIKKFTFPSNLEFISEELQERKIKHYPNFETGILMAYDNDKDEILKIISTLNLDENEVEIDENVLEGYKEWNQNMYNPGHFTGGKNPYFQIDKNNFLMMGYLTLFSGIIALVQLFSNENFSRTGFWISFVVIALISASMFYQHYKFKNKKKDK